MPASVLIVDDDSYFRKEIRERLSDCSIHCIEAGCQTEAIKLLSQRHKEIGVALLDMRIPSQDGAGDADAVAGRYGGIRLARTIRVRYPGIRLIGMSVFPEQDAQEWFSLHGYCFLPKSWVTTGVAREFIGIVEKAAKTRQRKRKPRTFVVHGHATQPLRELVDFIRTSLRWPQPRILRELPSYGRTIIEKFEAAAESVDIVFVLLTPDDVAAPAAAANEVKRRARQNVIFELGYFFAKLQRTGGRVVMLHGGPLELPSDIAGIVYIDISNGVEASGEMLRRELAQWL